MLKPEWRTDEPAWLVEFERLVHAAVNIGAIAFGIHAAIFAICTYHFTKAKRFPVLQQLYITILFLLAGVTIGCNIGHNQLTWIDYRSYPGGPGAFIQEQQGHFVNTIGNSAGLTLAFMVDSLLIYRAFVVWNSNFYVIILPSLLLIASTVMAILQTIAASLPESALWNERAVQFGLPYFALSMTINMLVTVIIISRLLLARRQIRQVMGSQHGKEYTGVAAMLVESAVPPALVSIVLIALYAEGILAQVLFYPLLPQVQAIAPQLIFIRVMRGRAWNKNTANQVSTGVRFGTATGTGMSSGPSATLNSSKRGLGGWKDSDEKASSSINANRSASDVNV